MIMISEVNGDDWCICADREDALSTAASRIAQGLGAAPYTVTNERSETLARIEHRPTARDRWNCIEVDL